MFENIMTFMNNWNATKSERQKMQHIYLVLTIAIVIVAGIFGLFDADLGHNFVLLSLVTLGVFFVNAISWNLLQSALLSKLSKRRSTTSKKKKR